MKICAVIDTNVLVAALLSKHSDAATVQVIRAMLSRAFVPLWHPDILAEYDEVLHRTQKYRFSEQNIQIILNAFRLYGVEVFPQPSGELLADADDLIFYEVALEKQDEHAWLVTGNQKHYPIRPFVVTPAEMLEILRKETAQ